ncbi:competence type IV pilus minor pilin ComGG [Geobacillus subterraneus]|uniref:competence type IV pilus minor pilin ComGG n=1 Tax=Geobacillus subterraneus TaxID=129338 RepID=UPI00160A9321
MGRQDGVIFPLVAVVALLLAFSVTHVLLLYEVEQEAAHAARQAAEADELVQMAVFDVKEQIAASGPSTAVHEGEWTYPRGTAAYRWEKVGETSVRVSLSVHSSSGLRRSAAFTVMIPSLHITEWSEQND